MDIGQLRNNTTYYDGFEGEDELVIELVDDQTCNVHIWMGYIDDILKAPDLSGAGWQGLTRDYHQLENAFSERAQASVQYPSEYLSDILMYKDRQFDNPESSQVLALIIQFLEHAIAVNSQIRLSVQ